MKKIQRLALFLLGIFLGVGCASNQPVPKEWNQSEKEISLVAPLGRFANHGESSNLKVDAPTLSALIFDKQLEGFDIDNIVFQAGDKEDRLRIQPQVGNVPLKERRDLEAERRKGEPMVWTAKTKTSYIDGYGATASVLWTGGAIMPLSSWKRYRFYIGSEGELLIHLKSKDLIDFFYVFPIPLTSEVWLRYPKFERPLFEPESAPGAPARSPTQ